MKGKTMFLVLILAGALASQVHDKSFGWAAITSALIVILLAEDLIEAVRKA